MTLYLKYRPQKIDELDLSDVRSVLGKVIASGSIPHAFLFFGPKGTGKTSAARILAKVLNCEKPDKNGEPCDKCEQCISIIKGENMDVIELDAASHRGIDDIRQLREVVKLSPARAGKKVYIIDEAHMLTTEASNALLKTLEEPPEHVYFILATTNPEKLIQTIRSRTTAVSFTKATTAEIARSLGKVIRGENLKVDDRILEMVAKASDGSFRDAVKLLEQSVSEGKTLSEESIEKFLFNRGAFNTEVFLEALVEKDAKKSLEIIEMSINRGVSAKAIAHSVLEKLRQLLFSKVGLRKDELSALSKNDLIFLIKRFSQAEAKIPASYIEQIPLEIAVVEWCQRKIKDSINDGGVKDGRKEKKKDDNKEIGAKRGNTKKVVKKGVKSREPVFSGGGDDMEMDGFSEDVWFRVLSQVRPKNTSTEALLRASKPVGFDKGKLTLGVYYKFHKERLEANPHRQILEETIETVVGDRVKVICTLTEPPVKRKKERDLTNEGASDKNFGPENINLNVASEGTVLTEAEDNDIVKVAKEIFGS